ncbi:hypothetical protein [Mycobacterium terramassiliense]|uniref:Uncharacterized protein n=1 Tax=Mycobacterium terramassiliense TaxID=1841859 RepID=A0A2U3NEQ5_9MYCO|nr:hypothetical protein [Mycobacterium terramassiliense]SPM29977.1 hypothetical protein MTAB308_3475 [Mycobacterium terramassiliense]
MTRSRSWRAPLTAACVVCAVAALGLVSVASADLYLTGFPDSHFTDYDKAADTPKRILIWVEVAFVLAFLTLAFAPIGTRARAIGSLAAVVALALVALVQWIGIPWYFITHLGLDNGIGG